MTEAELIARAKAGDQGAFEQLVLDNQNRVYSLALRMLGDPEDAQDAAQEAFLNAWRALPTFKGESSFSTWVYRLTCNACIDHLQPPQAPPGPGGRLPHRRGRRRATGNPPTARPDPALQTERRMAKEAVEAGLQALPDHQREILVMRELSGLSYQEIGAALDLDLGTVKSRIARARLALKKILTAERGTFLPLDTSTQKEGTKRR